MQCNAGYSVGCNILQCTGKPRRRPDAQFMTTEQVSCGVGQQMAGELVGGMVGNQGAAQCNGQCPYKFVEGLQNNHQRLYFIVIKKEVTFAI